MSQCDRILAVLKDGKPHRMEEIHQRVGFCRLNSRVSELRERGHAITCDKAGGIYTYRLLREADEVATETPSLSASLNGAVRDADEAERLGPDGSPHHGPSLDGSLPGAGHGSGASLLSPEARPAQLTVWEAAA